MSPSPNYSTGFLLVSTSTTSLCAKGKVCGCICQSHHVVGGADFPAQLGGSGAHSLALPWGHPLCGSFFRLCWRPLPSRVGSQCHQVSWHQGWAACVRSRHSTVCTPHALAPSSWPTANHSLRQACAPQRHSAPTARATSKGTEPGTGVGNKCNNKHRHLPLAAPHCAQEAAGTCAHLQVLRWGATLGREDPPAERSFPSI